MSHAFALVLAVLSATPAHAAEARLGNIVMGTVLQVRIVADTQEEADELAARAFAIAQHWDDVLTTWRPEGELQRLNAAAGEGRRPISVDLHRGLDRMVSLAEATRGAFHPAVGAYLRGGSARGPVPAVDDVLELHGLTASLRGGVALDAGAIGKGMALDAMAAMLQERDADTYLLDFGGSSHRAGRRASADWKLVVTGLDEGVVHGHLIARAVALSTSRSGPAAAEHSPLIDPRDGKAVVDKRLCSVLAADATNADAWSTALVVLGRDGLARARAAGIEFLYEDVAGVVMSAGFRERLKMSKLGIESHFQNH